ncbi:squalene--hopene cyclase [Pseudalkalibacillus salsuginis]|uniref:squalene--hopene cyclase n=1 Tax=Pseudalkalibacillus salsuginis TaxID=2910972 RepID=UPI001F2C6CFA|nr:squalene--hopene cyclase [Pseudalkalibacillus salsuginis]MCF6411694.1 squalene--hopene cyclase [Pseudalkalibacillus salsuginis]
MNLKDGIEREMNRLISILLRDQTRDGSWNYAFETGIATDSYMIILLRSFKINDERLIQALIRRIINNQEENGGWKLFHDAGEGDLSSTIQAYYALLYSGYLDKNDPRIIAAKNFIIEQGGIERAETFTKTLLAITGQYSWDSLVPLPIEIMLFPQSSPLNFYDFSVFGRANIAPILILSHFRYHRKTSHTPDLSDLYVNHMTGQPGKRNEEWRNLLSFMKDQLQKLTTKPAEIKKKAVSSAKQYILKRIEPDGTLLSYFSSTFLMIFALNALGYKLDDPLIRNAIDGLRSMAIRIDDAIHMQYTTANVWNTALISHVLQDAGLPSKNAAIQRANHYLLSRQHTRFGDWVLRNPNTMPGGWGFSNINTINPDVDDSTASLRSICELVEIEPAYQQGWTRGIRWVLSMQNDDGGWPAFERGVNKKWLAVAPIQGAEHLLLDPSTSDLTGRTLEFLGNYTSLNKDSPIMKKGVNWLKNNQREEGSWYGRWGICYIYGTWAALTGMAAAGKTLHDQSVQKAVEWLHSIQNSDGGWGESCKSDIERKYIPLGESTLTQTAWALDALIAVTDESTAEIEKGIVFLIRNGGKDDWTTRYPKGQGMAGGFYIHYHSYRYIWPLLTLSNYQKKFTG